MKIMRYTIGILLAALMLQGLSNYLHAGEKAPSLELNKDGEKLFARYEKMLASLREEISAQVPAIDETRKKEFLKFRAAYSALNAPDTDASADTRKEYNDAKKQASSNALDIARVILADVDDFLSDEKLDEKLMKVAILTHGTPRGLAEFAQQGMEQQELLESFFADVDLMKQVLLAGGANGGEYGEAMEVYAAIQESSERAREKGTIFQRLALGTALHQPWLKGREKGGVYGSVFADHDSPDGQVARYLHYEKACLDGELDEAFKDMNTWECRFITNDPYTNEELGWTREMMRNYRPDLITNPDPAWRYTKIVKTDVPYKTPDWRPDEGTTKSQQIVAGGGKCGPRAFYGRTSTRAFGIPARRSTQSGHAAMNRWSPDGWIVRFGAWWSWNWCGPWGGEDFFLESQTREHPEEFMKVLRAQWIGDVLGEDDVSIRHYGIGGGLWNSLAFCKKQAVAEEAQAEALQAALAALSEEEAKVQLGETDEASDEIEENPMIDIPEKERTIAFGEDGTITIPVGACSKPTNNTDRIIFMKNLEDETQVHYARLGKRPELLRYDFDLPKAGKYELEMKVCTVGRDQGCLLRLNRRTLIDVDLPSTWGMWEDSKPVEVDLREGRNTIMFTCQTPNRGVSIKRFLLKPLK